MAAARLWHRRCIVGFSSSPPPLGRRLLSVSAALSGRYIPPPPKRKVYDIPGIEPITYADRMHYVPWLAKPKFDPWIRDWHDPFHGVGNAPKEHTHYKEKPCYMFHQNTRLLEGVKQTLWLSKSKLIEGLPPKILDITEDPAYQIANQDEKVQNIIRHARFWSTTEELSTRQKFCPTLLQDLLHLCSTLTSSCPSLFERMLAENYQPAATWLRESNLLQVRGTNGWLLSAKRPLAPLASRDEILTTENHVLETFYPISPLIDLQKTQVYLEKNDTGFQDGYPYPHPHTVYISNSNNKGKRFKEYHLRSKMIMFAFGNALAKAKALYADDTKILEHPVVVQSVGTDGRTFQFLVFQLNTMDFDSSDGVKNLIWMDSDQPLYDYAKCRPVIRKREIVVPAGLYGYQPNTFKKFLALYLHGAV
uniref:Large ribosomal subunit protein mL37 n=1 Tax=Geotrypetes seraphini TaxID=260995 RepID=A0A6P8P9E9_GEOSA|nr:39S ribosomal protein L37, mitochondrial [Geotrypetes seraphini]XP_033772160.1 39S ribosomal protein L37, mitochondrial [Geotrypetes seraphini]XP_033772161.1 39S ribosomal protein L37, mitochondrial [Geotrypetes seraphini]